MGEVEGHFVTSQEPGLSEESETSATSSSSSDDTTTTTSSSHYKHAHAYQVNTGRRLIQASRVPKATFGVVANAESALMQRLRR